MEQRKMWPYNYKSCITGILVTSGFSARPKEKGRSSTLFASTILMMAQNLRIETAPVQPFKCEMCMNTMLTKTSSMVITESVSGSDVVQNIEGGILCASTRGEIEELWKQGSWWTMTTSQHL
jgi:hypothetical protein